MKCFRKTTDFQSRLLVEIKPFNLKYDIFGGESPFFIYCTVGLLKYIYLPYYPYPTGTSFQEDFAVSYLVEDYKKWKKEINGGLDATTVAECIYFAYSMPQSVSIREIVLTKTNQED